MLKKTFEIKEKIACFNRIYAITINMTERVIYKHEIWCRNEKNMYKSCRYYYDTSLLK